MARYGVWAPIPQRVGGTTKWAYGRNNRRLTAVVIHRMEGSLMGSDSYLRREFADYSPYPRLNASTHFGIGDWNGYPQIRQWVDTANTAWGWSGRPTQTPTAVAQRVLTNLWSPSEDLNWQVISVEVAGFHYQSWNQRWTPKLRELLNFLYRAHGNLRILLHTDCSIKPCPGAYAFTQGLPGWHGNTLANILGAAPAPAPTPIGNMEGFPVRFRPLYGRSIRIGAGVNVRRGTATDGSKPLSHVDFTTNGVIQPKILGITLGGALGGRRGWYVWWKPTTSTSDTWDGRLVYVHENYARLV